MSVAPHESGFAIARAVVARREQAHVRVGLCVVIAVVFHAFSGITAAVIWAIAYSGLQGLEYVVLRNVTGTVEPRRRMMVAFFALMLTSSFAFAFFGILESMHGGVWGILGASLLWSGAIFNGAMVSGESRLALGCSVLPPLLHFLSVPYFALENGGTFGIGAAILAGGVLNGVGAIAISATYRRLLARAAHEREASRLALHDPETGLSNRYAVQRRVAEIQKAAHEGVVVVAAISIDRFLHLRGAIGHALMLDLIREVAARFSHVHRDVPIARITSGMLGFAFAVRDMSEARRIAAGLQATLTTPVLLGGNRVDVSVTIGLSEAADTVASATELSIIDRALIAVDQARAARHPIKCFDPVLYGCPGSNLSLMSEMLRALENGQMSLAYQPKYSLRSGIFVGAEALVRWTHPERGALRPDLFVQMAEETGHIAALTEWVLRRAVADQRALRAAGYDLCISINWSGVVINDSALTDRVLQIAHEAPGKICLEVTETAIIGNPQLARQTLERFRAAGIAISIDDYGSGLSSLAYLKTIPADELKIDKAFVVNLASDTTDAVLVRSAVTLAHSLGLRVVAEGVENAGALELLYAMGCDLAQGYLIARPMPLADLMAFLRSRALKVG
jgi:EAL domain-containing protein (putative c-di-GMP-specific phosphodiesterase class I)/GGDEF domain-containing protein